MNETLEQKLVDIVGRYFSDEEVHRLMEDLRKWEIDESCLFYQIAQEGDHPSFEIAFKVSSIIFDLTYRTEASNTTSLRVGAISQISMHDTELTTSVLIDTVVQGLSYTASTDTNRQSLRAFYEAVQAIIAEKEQP